MSGEEAGAHRAPGTIVRNSAVFRDRSARCTAASRPFSPRGLLWLFLRKKEQENLRGEACGVHDNMAGLRRRRLRPARRKSAAVLRKLKVYNCFLCTFGLTQKYQKVKHGEKLRVSSTAFSPRFSQCDCAGRRAASSSRGSCFTTFCHQKVVPKVSARHLRRDRTTVLTERARKTALIAHPLRAFEPPSALFPPAVHCGSCGALRATIISVAAIYFRQAADLPASDIFASRSSLALSSKGRAGNMQGALVPSPPLFLRFSQCGRAGLRPAEKRPISALRFVPLGMAAFMLSS